MKRIQRIQEIQKITFKKDSYYCNKTNWYPISFAILGIRDSNNSLQSRLFHNPGGFP